MSPDTSEPDGDVGEAEPSRLVIRVERTGGFAGLRREWSISVRDQDEVDRWRPVLDACPWDDDEGPQPVSPDRFVYEIRVTLPQRERSAVLPEQRVTGPWRQLVDRVREADENPKTVRPRTGGRGI